MTALSRMRPHLKITFLSTVKEAPLIPAAKQRKKTRGPHGPLRGP